MVKFRSHHFHLHTLVIHPLLVDLPSIYTHTRTSQHHIMHAYSYVSDSDSEDVLAEQIENLKLSDEVEVENKADAHAENSDCDSQSSWIKFEEEEQERVIIFFHFQFLSRNLIFFFVVFIN